MKPTFNHVLVPTDFGDAAGHAFDIAIAVAQKFGADITLMHSYGVPISYPYDGSIVWPIEQLRRSAEAEMQEAVAKAAKTFPKLRSLLVSGEPTADILDAVRATRADLVVMGTHGRRGIARFFLGSVAEKVVRLAGAPVLTVPARSR